MDLHQSMCPPTFYMGPLLFLLFINDSVNEIHANIWLFADETRLYLIMEHSNVTAQLLNINLETIAKWPSYGLSHLTLFKVNLFFYLESSVLLCIHISSYRISINQTGWTVCHRGLKALAKIETNRVGYLS